MCTFRGPFQLSFSVEQHVGTLFTLELLLNILLLDGLDFRIIQIKPVAPSRSGPWPWGVFLTVPLDIIFLGRALEILFMRIQLEQELVCFLQADLISIRTQLEYLRMILQILKGKQGQDEEDAKF